jgi:hypothetical protein
VTWFVEFYLFIVKVRLLKNNIKGILLNCVNHEMIPHKVVQNTPRNGTEANDPGTDGFKTYQPASKESISASSKIIPTNAPHPGFRLDKCRSESDFSSGKGKMRMAWRNISDLCRWKHQKAPSSTPGSAQHRSESDLEIDKSNLSNDGYLELKTRWRNRQISDQQKLAESSAGWYGWLVKLGNLHPTSKCSMSNESNAACKGLLLKRS